MFHRYLLYYVPTLFLSCRDKMTEGKNLRGRRKACLGSWSQRVFNPSWGGGQGRRMLEEELSAQQPELVGEAVHITVDQTRPKSTAGTRVSHFLW